MIKQLLAITALMLCFSYVSAISEEQDKKYDWRNKYTTYYGTSCCGENDCHRMSEFKSVRIFKKNKTYKVVIGNMALTYYEGSVHNSEDGYTWICYGEGKTMGVRPLCLFLGPSS